MSGLVVPQVASGLSNEELADIVSKFVKEVEWFANGNISSQNVRNIAGYNVSETELRHKSGIVGMSGFDAANPLAVRFWSGDADKYNAPFRVLQSGALFATDAFITGRIEGSVIVGSEIMTKEPNTYPRAAMSSSSNLFAAEASATDSITIEATGFGEALMRILGPGVTGQIFPQLGKLLIQTAFHDGGIQISSGDHLELFVTSLDTTKMVKVNSWARFWNDASGHTLQQDLDAKQNTISGDTGVFTTVDGKTVIVADGIVTSIF